VHSYCENRIVAAVFGVLSTMVFLLFFRNKAGSTARKIARRVGQTLSFLGLALNVAFIVYATHLCRHMFDQLR
jgi:hypothetical protein